jgi:hypothetical protein
MILGGIVLSIFTGKVLAIIQIQDHDEKELQAKI